MLKVFRFLFEKARFEVVLMVSGKEISMNRPSSGELGGVWRGLDCWS